MSSQKPAIRAQGLGKLYQLSRTPQHGSYRTLRESMMNGFGWWGRRTAARSDAAFWALRDVDLDVRDGAALGVIGPNGAGKSTLLKILTRVTVPTEGSADVWGKVASLLEVGTGFHPELTGRENIYFSAAMLGMRKSDIERRLEEIIDFAGIERFVDQPIKRYSTGMYLRLGFSVAAHLEPDVLIVDEVLAVGDHQFRARCLGKMGDATRSGRTVLMVSHNMAAITDLCPTTLLLVNGGVAALGQTSDVIARYLATTGALEGRATFEHSRQAKAETGFRFTSVSVRNPGMQFSGTVDRGPGIEIGIEYEVFRNVMSCYVGLELWTQAGVCVLTSMIADSYPGLDTSAPVGRYCVRCKIRSEYLRGDRYSVHLRAVVPNITPLDIVEDALSFEVIDLHSPAAILARRRTGVVAPVLDWTLPLREPPEEAPSDATDDVRTPSSSV